MTKKKNTIYQLWDAAKAKQYFKNGNLLNEMTILDKNKSLHINDLSFHHKKLKNKEQMKYTISRRKNIPLIKGQIN